MSMETAGPGVPPGPYVLVMPAQVTLADVPPLCERLRELYGDGAGEVVCDLAALTRADLASVEAVARLRLTARRAGRGVTLRNARPELLSLLELVGLGATGADDTVPPGPHTVTRPRSGPG
ncbi:STAS domain-containing protein [Streptomyces sp. CAU 1734]|uniref:STAS domain-containing protein n=1 Tax=Streptomyces sp. CAU 1734 TaxID=3140360 RepID=UPI003260679E